MSLVLLKLIAPIVLVGGGIVGSPLLFKHLSENTLLSSTELHGKLIFSANDLKNHNCKGLVNSFDNKQQVLICQVRDETSSIAFFKLEKLETNNSAKLHKIEQFNPAIKSWESTSWVQKLQLKLTGSSVGNNIIKLPEDPKIPLESLKEMDLSSCTVDYLTKQFSCKKRSDSTQLTSNYLDTEYLIK